MPGATTARFVVCFKEMPMKLFMMPHTVPNSPTNGAVAPIVASGPVPRTMARPTAASIRSRREATRSFTPSLSAVSADIRSSVTAARTNSVTRARWRSCWLASASEAAFATTAPAARSRRLAMKSSSPFAKAMVQVTSEANANPIITALTIRSALRNIPHGERSGDACADISAVSGPGAAASVFGFGAAAGAERPGAGGWAADCAEATPGRWPRGSSTVQDSTAMVQSLEAMRCIILGSQLLRQADEITPARAVLRSEHADTRAVSDLINCVSHVHHVEAHCEGLQAVLGREFVRDPGIDLCVGRHVAAIWHGDGSVRIEEIGAQPAAV